MGTGTSQLNSIEQERSMFNPNDHVMVVADEGNKVP